MTKIKYDSDNFNMLANSFKKNNEEILESIKAINYELSTIKTVLDTPKSSEIIPKYVDSLNEMEEYLNNSMVIFNNIFEMVKSEYNNFSNETSNAVGDSNE